MGNQERQVRPHWPEFDQQLSIARGESSNERHIQRTALHPA
jgi:transcriptional regulator GlxA family with amidase domain